MRKCMLTVFVVLMGILFVACGQDVSSEKKDSNDVSESSVSDQGDMMKVHFLAVRGGERVYAFAYGVAPTGGYNAGWQAARFTVEAPDPDSMTTQALEPFVTVSMGFTMSSEASGIGFTSNGEPVERSIVDTVEVSDIGAGTEAASRAIYKAIAIDGSAYVFAFGVCPPEIAYLYWEENRLMSKALDADSELVPAFAIGGPIKYEAGSGTITIIDADGEKEVELVEQ